MTDVWRKCSICAKEIKFGAVYQRCNVSTCKKKFAYCSVRCWDEHLPVMNHKEAWAEENRAPFSAEEDKPVVRRKIVTPKGNQNNDGQDLNSSDLPKDILIVASKLKSYIKARGDLNTSAEVMETLSQIVRREADRAISRAKADGRKTVMSRDF